MAVRCSCRKEPMRPLPESRSRWSCRENWEQTGRHTQTASCYWPRPIGRPATVSAACLFARKALKIYDDAGDPRAAFALRELGVLAAVDGKTLTAQDYISKAL